MTIAIEIKDEKQLEQIEKLRGDFPAEDFARLCLATGMRFAREARQGGPAVAFPPARPEFRNMPAAEITEALKAKDPAHPAAVEVKRLVETYSAELKKLAVKNGNRLPPRLAARVQAPIEKIALDITAAAINKALQAAREAGKAAPESKAAEAA